jgi:hypothetical protein
MLRALAPSPKKSNRLQATSILVKACIADEVGLIDVVNLDA